MKVAAITDYPDPRPRGDGGDGIGLPDTWSMSATVRHRQRGPLPLTGRGWVGVKQARRRTSSNPHHIPSRRGRGAPLAPVTLQPCVAHRVKCKTCAAPRVWRRGLVNSRPTSPCRPPRRPQRRNVAVLRLRRRCSCRSRHGIAATPLAAYALRRRGREVLHASDLPRASFHHGHDHPVPPSDGRPGAARRVHPRGRCWDRRRRCWLLRHVRPAELSAALPGRRVPKACRPASSGISASPPPMSRRPPSGPRPSPCDGGRRDRGLSRAAEPPMGRSICWLRSVCRHLPRHGRLFIAVMELCSSCASAAHVVGAHSRRPAPCARSCASRPIAWRSPHPWCCDSVIR